MGKMAGYIILNCCISFKTSCLLSRGGGGGVYCLLFTGCFSSYEVLSPKPRVCGSDICRQEENFVLGNSHGI